MKLYRLPVVTWRMGGGGGRAPRRWWDCSGLDRRSEGIPRYTNAAKTVFVPEWTIVTNGGRFVKIVDVCY